MAIKFDAYEISEMVEGDDPHGNHPNYERVSGGTYRDQLEEEDATFFWCLFGHTPAEGLQVVAQSADFSDLVDIYQKITGNDVRDPYVERKRISLPADQVPAGRTVDGR